MTDPIYCRIAMFIVALAAWLGLGIQFYATQTNPNLASVSPFERTIRYLEYFTILTNLLVAVATTISLIAPKTTIGRFLSRPSVQTAIAVYIALVGLIYNLVLQGLHEFSGPAYVADMLTHDIVPILYVVYWVVCVKKGGLTWKMPIVWTIYPLVYLGLVLIRGPFTGRYPYPFLDVGTHGLGGVMIHSVVVMIVFLVLGEIFVVADRLLARLPSQRPELAQ
ncbi:MAG TPA: Pr6Pr family membrane protein [Pyrinomonadaceae bacterium]|nr:Pr6Pr family membrane protein [Pyrinomonadaceae bacterium]